MGRVSAVLLSLFLSLVIVSSEAIMLRKTVVTLSAAAATATIEDRDPYAEETHMERLK
jgi:hypothetical protein